MRDFEILALSLCLCVRSSTHCGLLEYDAAYYPSISYDSSENDLSAFYRWHPASGTFQRRNDGEDDVKDDGKDDGDNDGDGDDGAGNSSQKHFKAVHHTMALKRRSLFCIEPEGLYPGRKSQSARQGREKTSSGQTWLPIVGVQDVGWWWRGASHSNHAMLAGVCSHAPSDPHHSDVDPSYMPPSWLSA